MAITKPSRYLNHDSIYYVMCVISCEFPYFQICAQYVGASSSGRLYGSILPWGHTQTQNAIVTLAEKML